MSPVFRDFTGVHGVYAVCLRCCEEGTSPVTDEATEQAIRRLVSLIVEAVHPLRVILFGSAVRGEASPESDLDVLVVMPDGTPRLKTARELYRRIRGVGAPFDLIVATPSLLEEHRDNPGLIYHAILREGRTLYAA